jgi:hypothetical protein
VVAGVMAAMRRGRRAVRRSVREASGGAAAVDRVSVLQGVVCSTVCGAGRVGSQCVALGVMYSWACSAGEERRSAFGRRCRRCLAYGAEAVFVAAATTMGAAASTQFVFGREGIIGVWH